MSVTSYNAEFNKKQQELAKHGFIRGPSGKKMNKEEYERFMNSPAMKSQARYDEVCNEKTSVRDKRRMQTDKSFRPSEEDWTARKAFEFDASVDYYRVLGVDEYETQDGIKKAYRRLSLIYHPDKTAGMGEDKAEEYQQIFIQINNAYLVLGDNATRRQYDKKRDDNDVAEELWGLVKKKQAEAQFDAFNIMEEIKAKKAKDSKIVLVQVPVKLEKMFFGGIKTVEKEVKRETLDGFVSEEKLIELVVPPCCKEHHGILRKAIGDHHKEQKPDHLNFRIKAKKHPRVQREMNDLKLKAPIKLAVSSLEDPYTSGEVPGLTGRVLLFLGRNPFYGINSFGASCLHVSVQGEGFGEEGKLCFDVEYAAGRPLPELAAAPQPLVQEVIAVREERAEHPTLRARRQQTQGRRMECFATLSPFGEPLHLATLPASSLRFYGNLGQSTVFEVSSGAVLRVPPRPLFAIVLSSPLGSKRWFQKEWQQINKTMLPLVWLSFWMLVPPMRRLQPKHLDNSPSLEEAEEELASPTPAQAEPLPDFLQVGQLEDTEVRHFLKRYHLGPPDGFPAMQPQETVAPESGAERSRLGRSAGAAGEDVNANRPAWAHPEPAGPPVVFGSELVAGKTPPAPEPRARYRAWRMYPHVMRRLPAQPRVVDPGVSATPMPWMRMGDAAWKLGDFWSAYKHFSEAAREAGFSEPVCNLEERDEGEAQEGKEGCGMGQLNPSGEDGDEEETLENRRSVAAALARRADCLQQLQQFQAALANARRAAQLLPKWSEAWRRVGVLEARVGNPSAAWDALFTAVDMDARDQKSVELLQKLKLPNSGDASILARSEKIAGNSAFREKPSEALAHYTAALAALQVPTIGPDNDPEKRQEDEVRLIAEIFSNRSAAFARLRLWEPAVTDARRALALPGRSCWVKGQVRLGTALLGAGRPEQAYLHFARAVAVLPDDAPAASPARVGREACLILAGCWSSSVAQARRFRFSRDAGLPRGQTRVLVTSDIHFDHPLADEWVYKISKTKFQQDILIVAGDVAENLNKLRTCLRHLRSKFRRVFFTPGNHDLWIHTSEEKEIPDSIDKLFRLLELCDELDVDTFPAAVCEGLVLMPLFSWYNADYDRDDPFPSTRYFFDKYCKWPMDKDLHLWRYMMYLNHQFFELPCEGTTITFSHFLPRHGLPFWKHIAGLSKAVGCPQLDAQVRKAGSSCHIFGHSHHKCNKVEDGVRYVQNPLGYKEEHGPDEALFCVFDGKKGGLVAEPRSLTRLD